MRVCPAPIIHNIDAFSDISVGAFAGKGLFIVDLLVEDFSKFPAELLEISPSLFLEFSFNPRHQG
jgi:hypothetical protein